MKNFIFKLAMTIAFICCANPSANAQGFLKKLKNVAGASASKETAVTTLPKINWENVPVYHAEETLIVDDNGNPVLNEDGTQQIRVFLIDQNGNKRSAESVKAQINSINQSIALILAKVGVGAAAGALAKGGTGAVVGAASGAVASIDDIKNAKAQKKSLNQQKKLLAAYEKNFTAEGVPVNANVDISKLEDLDLKPEAKKSATAEQVKQELGNADFNSSDTSAWEIVE